MKRIAVLLTLLSLSLVPAAGWAQEAPDRPSPDWFQAPYAFQGEVLSVDAAAGTIEARVEVSAGAFEGERPPAGTTLTFHTDAETRVLRNAEPAVVDDLRRGDLVVVVVLAEPGLTADEVAGRPAFVVSAFRHPMFYGFAGRIRHVDAADGTLTLSVRYATPDARRLLDRHEGQRTLTFTIDESTEIVRNGRRVEAGALRRGDLAGVGVLASRNAHLGDVLATPARAVVAVRRTRAAARSFGRLGRRAARSAGLLLP